MNPAVFFDKDGILNEVVMRGIEVSSPRSLSEFKIKPGAQQLSQVAKSAGFLTIVATNQPDLTLGRMSQESFAKMLSHFSDFGFDRIEVCRSSDSSDPRMKPNPGMLFDAAVALNIDLTRSYFIGDHKRDIEAGRRAGVKTILLEADYNRGDRSIADFDCASLDEIGRLLQNEARKLGLISG